ncbi:hypothetical protein CANARDRAFT_189688, partial [[Candida] arabinofermentans NRRL YB-2248]
KYVKFPKLEKIRSSNPGISHSLLKRSGEPAMNFADETTWYSTVIYLGTPAQSLSVQIDTGSSFFWVTSATNYNCEEYNTIAGQLNCTSITYFSAGDSDSFSSNLTFFQIDYSGGDGAWGFWGKDTLAFDDIEIPDFKFGIAQYSTSDTNVLGIGLPTDDDSKDENLAYMLQSNGDIDRVVYSIDIAVEEAALLFGAVDKSKYVGPLFTAPMVGTDTPESITELAVTLSLVSLVSSNGSLVENTNPNGGLIAAVLDTGSTYSMFSPSFVKQFLSVFGISKETDDSYYFLSCSKVKGYSIAFNFQGFEMHVPLTQFVDGQDGDTCKVVIFNSGYDEMVLLGDNFLRYVYYVVDLERLEISIARVNPCPTSEEIQTVTGSIPNSTPVPDFNN